MSFVTPKSQIKLIKVYRCAKKTCNRNIENHCKATPEELAEKGCFSKFTGSVMPKKEETLENVFK